MTSFQQKPLHPPKRVCIRLKECREARGLTIADVARQTRISQKYLEALEACRFEDIPFGMIYQKNFIKRYAAAIDVPPHDFLDQYLEEEVVTPTLAAPTVLRSLARFPNMPGAIRIALISFAVLFTIGYLGYQVKQSIDPPTLSVFAPPDGFITHTPTITVHGATEEGAQVFINNESIVMGTNGQFEERMYLSPGVNTIIVSAKKKHGKTTIETRHVIVKTPDQLSKK